LLILTLLQLNSPEDPLIINLPSFYSFHLSLGRAHTQTHFFSIIFVHSLKVTETKNSSFKKFIKTF